MYKVFIDNTALFITTEAPKESENCVVIYSEDVRSFRDAVFSWTSKVKNYDPVYLVTSKPESAFAKMFEAFEYIEAAGGIVKKENRYLFIKRHGYWDIPKGKLDKGERTDLGAIREIEEECGISNPTIDHLICSTYHTYKLKGKPKIKKTYWYALNYDGDETPVAQVEEGITKVKWFLEEDLFKVTDNTFASIIDVMKVYFVEKGIPID